MAIRMIVSDLDGTLLDSAYRLSAANRTALREAAAQGVRVLLATGRMFASAVRYAKELALDTPVISYNGGVVQEMDGTLLHAGFLRRRQRRLDFTAPHPGLPEGRWEKRAFWRGRKGCRSSSWSLIRQRIRRRSSPRSRRPSRGRSR